MEIHYKKQRRQPLVYIYEPSIKKFSFKLYIKEKETQMGRYFLGSDLRRRQ
jgi:hypothetical protein